MKIHDFNQKISNFLFGKTNKELLIFLFFFAVAGIFWLLMTLNESYEQEIRVPVYYTNVPKSVVFSSSETDTVRITVHDKGIMLLTYLYGDMLKPIPIDFSNHVRKNGSGEVQASELIKIITPKLSASSKLISVKPEKLSFFYNFGERKKVPVKWAGHVKPDDLFFIANTVYEPDSITVYALREKLDSLDIVNTEILNYTKFRDTLTVKTKLQKMPGVKMVPNEITIRFMTDVLTEESIENIPVEGINMPKGKVLRLFPAKVGVKFVAGVKTYQRLSVSDFKVVADYNEIKTAPSQKCTIKLVKKPEGISQVQLNYTELDYLIEEVSND